MVMPSKRRCSRCGTEFLGGDAFTFPVLCSFCEDGFDPLRFLFDNAKIDPCEACQTWDIPEACRYCNEKRLMEV